MELNLIVKEYPVTYSIKKSANPQNGIYKLKDNYFKFYYKFVFPNISELEEYNIDIVYDLAVKPFLNEYTSYIFEDVCISYLKRQNKKNNLPFNFLKIGRWWDKNNEIDIVAFDNQGNAILGECKWKNSKVSKNELFKLIEKSNHIDIKFNNIYYFLFSKSGFDDELISLASLDEKIKLISLEDLFI